MLRTGWHQKMLPAQPPTWCDISESCHNGTLHRSTCCQTQVAEARHARHKPRIDYSSGSHCKQSVPQQKDKAHSHDPPSQHSIKSRTSSRESHTLLAFFESLIASDPFALAITVLLPRVREVEVVEDEMLIELECDVAYQAFLGGFLDLANFDLTEAFDVVQEFGMSGVDELRATVSEVRCMRAKR